MEEDDKGRHGTGTAPTNALMSTRGNKSLKHFFDVRGTSESDIKSMLKKKYDRDGNGVFDEEEVDDMMGDLMGYMSGNHMLMFGWYILASLFSLPSNPLHSLSLSFLFCPCGCLWTISWN